MPYVTRSELLNRVIRTVKESSTEFLGDDDIALVAECAKRHVDEVMEDVDSDYFPGAPGIDDADDEATSTLLCKVLTNVLLERRSLKAMIECLAKDSDLVLPYVAPAGPDNPETWIVELAANIVKVRRRQQTDVGRLSAYNGGYVEAMRAKRCWKCESLISAGCTYWSGSFVNGGVMIHNACLCEPCYTALAPSN